MSNIRGSADNPFDLLVVGGGINGAGIARDAAGRGLSVALCEKDDFASGTSSRSGKLVHGGLRYLEYYEFRLVREALIEREVLLESAPHIIWPMRFVLPHSSRDRPAWLLRLGLLLYDHLGGRKRLPPTRSLNLHKTPEGEVLKDCYKRAFEYSDCWVDDSRLVVLNILDAHEHGATILPRTRFDRACRENSQWKIEVSTNNKTSNNSDSANTATATLYAKGLVNAAGPWVNDVIDHVTETGNESGNSSGIESLTDATAKDAPGKSGKRVRLVKGSHIIVKKFWQGDNAYLVQNSDKRVIFINPYETEYALIGTTDTPHNGTADSVVADAAEIEYLLNCVNEYFKVQLDTKDIVHTFAGVRPLYDDNAANPSAVTRDYVFDITTSNNKDAPLLSIFGGKITTYRKLAEHALEKLAPHYPTMKPAWTKNGKLPGGDIANADFDKFVASLTQSYPWLDTHRLRHLARLYGSRTSAIIGNATSVADLGQEFAPGFFEAEARYLYQYEWAREPDDFLQRRSKQGLHMTTEQQEQFAIWCTENLHSPEPDM